MSLSTVEPLLKNLRVLELGHYIAAPYATRTLADLGADVIKVEPPGTGDPVRSWGIQEENGSLWWSIHGRNKRSVTLNLRDPKAPELVLKLAAQCDVVIENYKPGQLEKWGLTPEAFAKARPGMVLVRISGYGQTGPEVQTRRVWRYRRSTGRPALSLCAPSRNQRLAIRPDGRVNRRLHHWPLWCHWCVVCRHCTKRKRRSRRPRH